MSSSINISDLSPSVCMRWRPSCVRSHTLEDRCAGPQDQAQVHPLVSQSAMLDLTDAGRRLAEALLPHAESRGSVDKNIAIILVFVGGGKGAEAPHTSTYLIYHDPPSHNRRTDHLARSSCRCRRRRGAAVAAAAVAAVTADEHDAVDDHDAAAVTAVDDIVETYIV